MTVVSLIEQIAAGWNAYHQKVRVDKRDPIHTLVVRNFPQALEPYVSAFDNIIVQGSTGAGNITAAPWIALLDRRLTSSATTGFYVVYLFSTDMLTVTLSLAFGTTQFEEQFGGPSKAFPRMRVAAGRLQEIFNHLIAEHMMRGPIDLAAERRHKLHYAYEQAGILSYAPYRINALPDEAQIVADLKALVDLYTTMVSDPIEITVERLVEAAVEPVARVELIEMRDFSPHLMRTHRASNAATHQERRYSPESRKVGDAGERAVISYERKRLIQLGRQDLADRVRWHGPEREFFGWDITSFDRDGDELFIEVKSSIGKSVNCISLTANEWKAACHAARREHYCIDIVTDALSACPRIERLRNPASYIDSGRLECGPIVYELRLSGTQ